jgi:hypothetical protein
MIIFSKFDVVYCIFFVLLVGCFVCWVGICVISCKLKGYKTRKKEGTLDVLLRGGFIKKWESIINNNLCLL